MKLKGNTIFITAAAAGGIGRGLAEAFHKLGQQGDHFRRRRRAHLDAVIAANPGMAAIELDITNPASIAASRGQADRRPSGTECADQ